MIRGVCYHTTYHRHIWIYWINYILLSLNEYFGLSEVFEDWLSWSLGTVQSRLNYERYIFTVLWFRVVYLSLFPIHHNTIYNSRIEWCEVKGYDVFFVVSFIKWKILNNYKTAIFFWYRKVVICRILYKNSTIIHFISYTRLILKNWIVNAIVKIFFPIQCLITYANI